MAVDVSRAIHKPAPKFNQSEMKQYVADQKKLVYDKKPSAKKASSKKQSK